MIFGLVLAGGRSRRFGREKAVEPLGGRLLIDWVAGVLGPAVSRLAVSARPASGAADYAAARDLPCLVDAARGPLVDGPLAGVMEGLRWAEAGGARWLATAPCDTPLLPRDLVDRMHRKAGEGGAVARTAQGVQPLCALWPVRPVRELLEIAVSHPPIRRVLADLGAVEVGFEDAGAFDNLNTSQALAAAEARIAR